MQASERRLAWDGCLNVRDLGGNATEDGGETRFGAIVRADSVRELTAEGWRSLVSYGITRIVDLRQHSELEADPPLDVPVEVVHVPLFPEPGSAHWAELEALIDAAGDTVAATRGVYLECLERFRGEMGLVLTAIARVGDGGVVIHCRAGKDRTGLVSAVLLRLAGVSRDQVGADYALTEENLRAVWSEWVEQAEDEEEREQRRGMVATPAAVMVGVLTELEARYGTVRAYARAGGVAQRDLDRLADRLRA